MNIFYKLIAYTFFLASHFCWAQPIEARVALVIGNSSYKNAPLKNPANDSHDMAKKLGSLGFYVVERKDLTIRQIGATLREFGSKLTPGGVALVFYAGHGLQIKGKNYFPAVDADINGEEDVPNQSLSTEQIMDTLADAKTRLNLVFLDACRDNPFARGFRSSSRGLSRESAPSGTLVSFATRPGSVASDGDGRNGLYTGVLLREMANVNMPIEQLLKKVVGGVKQASANQQEPWMEGSIEGDFCFALCGPDGSSSADDHALWGYVKDSNNISDFNSYIEKFPAGLFVAIAKNRVLALERINLDRLQTLNKSAASSTEPPSKYIVQPSSKPKENLVFLEESTKNSWSNKTIKDCFECPEVVLLSGGKYVMGVDDGSNAAPAHTVTVGAFGIGKIEVTQSQWQYIMGSNPSRFKTVGVDLPVENISWNDAKTFVKKLSAKTGKKYRLPTEAEWEYSARANALGKWSYGDDEDRLGEFAWYGANSGGMSHPVSQKRPNNFGLFDMYGNVEEWVEDCYHPDYADAPTDGTAWLIDCKSDYRVRRGGSWGYDAKEMLASSRSHAAPGFARHYLGIRVARDLN
ncbi:SUMF1/EgtB/PvdO family nonheme iron enzyme [Rhodoferax aquaticus]|uniref:Caspase family p20 domain-containing protein n=1 Tax=Rhodoferax aquaticus TaxID=2527691 RepID=A0A515ER18_9BURK|nr:SUMF1/EgtB/PvdO family nonheme iron enzyme [Rhodoferax aquaticus]QDL55107.1 hypothetical protein EXZ61_13535 [Rhodoferax aquaticus]